MDNKIRWKYYGAPMVEEKNSPSKAVDFDGENIDITDNNFAVQFIGKYEWKKCIVL